MKNTLAIDILTEAREAELCRDVDRLQDIFSPLWPDISRDPDYSEFEPSVAAEFYRISGFFLSHYGRSRILPDFQLRGKDLVTKAIRTFQTSGPADKVAESRVTLALCYYSTGEMAECRDILDVAAQEFSDNVLHPVYQQIVANQVGVDIWFHRADSALKRIEDLSAAMQFCSDDRLLEKYHNKAGIVYDMIGRPEQSIFHLSEAIRYSVRAKNPRFTALNHNNRAMVYKGLGDFEHARLEAAEASRIFEDLHDYGWLANVRDTQAAIELEAGHPEKALEIIDAALDLLASGESSATYTDALFTKCRCLLRLDPASAETLFDMLVEKARVCLDNAAAEKYTGLYLDEIESIEREREAATRQIKWIPGTNTFFCPVKRRIASIDQTGPLLPGALILFEHDKEMKVGRIHYDSLLQLYLVGDEMISPTDIKIIGTVI